MKMKLCNLLIAFAFVLLGSSFAWSIPVIQSITPKNGTCKDDMGFTINLLPGSVTGTAEFYLLDYPTAGAQSNIGSNIATNLRAGTYKIGVHDASTGTTPVVGTVTVTTSYVDLTWNTPSVSKSTNNGCGDNGSITLSINNGKPPFRYKINGPSGTEVLNISNRSYTFTNLKAGSYTFEVGDACGEIRQEVPGTSLTVVTDPTTPTFTSFIINPPSIDQWYRVSGSCNTLSFSLDGDNSSYGSINGQLLQTYQGAKLRVVYPANSTNYTAWYTVNSYNILEATITNYSSDNKDYQIQIQHPCDPGNILTSNILQIEEKFTATVYNGSLTYTSHCDATQTSGYITVGTNSAYKASTIYNYYCGTYSVNFNAVSGPGTSFTRTLSSSSLTEYESAGNLVVGTTYDIVITRTATETTPAFSQTISGIVYNPSILTVSTPYINAYNRNSQGYNHAYRCDFNTGQVYVYNYSSYSGAVTYSISTTTIPGFVRSPITLSGTGYQYLWDDLPLGHTYTITADYYCGGPSVKTISLPKTYYDFKATTTLSFQTGTVCGRYKLVGRAYFTNSLDQPTTASSYERYYMKIIEAPAGVPLTTSSATYSNSDATIDGLLPGRYKVKFYPYLHVNGIDAVCAIESDYIILPEYILPQLDIALSGGISCETGKANMTVTASGSKTPFLYRYKKAEDPETAYYPADFQTSNIFPDLDPGHYQIQIKDQCGSITREAIRIFNGFDQFVAIYGNVAPGVICYGRSAQLSVLSIGPVKWYQWFKETSPGIWTELPGEIGPAYNIASATLADKGNYKVRIDNYSCERESEIEIIDVLPPPETPSITAGGTTSFCPGDKVLLTATTSIVSPTYKWFRDGLPVADNVNGPVYEAKETGAYTVEVTPSGACPSNPSNEINVSVAHPAAPSVSGSANFCLGQTTLLSTTSIPGAIYTWYRNGAIVSGATSNTYSAPSEGFYQVSYKLGAYCVSNISSQHTLSSYPTPTTPTLSKATNDKLCTGQSVLLTASGGVLPYIVEKDGVVVGTITVGNTYDATSAGSYTVKYTSADGCLSLASTAVVVEMHAPVLGGLIATSLSDLCYGASPSTITSTTSGSGGSGTGAYQWESSVDGGVTWYPIGGAASSTYTPGPLYVNTLFHRKFTNDCGSAYSNNLAINVNPELYLSSSNTNPSHFGAYNGSITLTGSGGTAPYTYFILGQVGTGPVFDNLAEGSYTATIVDSKGCRKEVIILLIQPTELTITKTAQSDVICNGGNTGSASFQAAGGTPSYSYSLDNIGWQPSATFSNLSAGNYTVYVKDNSGYTKTLNFTILEPSIQLVAADVEVPLTCPNLAATVTILNSKNGILYKVFNAASGGTLLGTGTGTGDGTTISINIGTHALSTMIYIETFVVATNCNAVARIEKDLSVRPTLSNYPDIRMQICPYPSRQLHLSSYLDTTDFKMVSWSVVTSGSPVPTTIRGTVSTTDLNHGSHVYTYTIENSCFPEMKRKVYLLTMKDHVVGKQADTVVVCKDYAGGINLKQVLGIAANGTWSCNDPGDAMNPYVKVVAPPSALAGAMILEGDRAYADFQNTTLMKGYKTDPYAVYLDFVYSTPLVPNSCLSNEERRLVVIVTSTLL